MGDLRFRSVKECIATPDNLSVTVKDVLELSGHDSE
jgi:hypothetical protein